MIIQTSSVSFGSVRQMKTEKQSLLSYSGWAGNLSNALSASTLPLATDSEQQTNETKGNPADTMSELIEKMNSEAGEVQRVFVNDADRGYKGGELVKFDSFKNLMMLLFPNAEMKDITPADLLKMLIEKLKVKVAGISGIATTEGLAPTQRWGIESISANYYSESESMTFTSGGKVKTADGREIDFDLTATMSRSFTSYANVQINYGSQMLVDPLVISLSDDTVNVSDQKFLFDIDSDGELDNISLLGKMCGFLALDANGDGIINDGSELFGTKTGDGFGELQVFDMDGNGWIDENDEIFDRLRIWTKDEDGNDRLMALGVAGVGAIYLGNIDSEFTIKSETSNDTQAVVRESGIYLTEDGKARMLSHVDLSTEA